MINFLISSWSSVVSAQVSMRIQVINVACVRKWDNLEYVEWSRQNSEQLIHQSSASNGHGAIRRGALLCHEMGNTTFILGELRPNNLSNGFLLKPCVCVLYAFVCVQVWRPLCTYRHIETRGQHQVSSSLSICLVFSLTELGAHLFG